MRHPATVAPPSRDLTLAGAAGFGVVIVMVALAYGFVPDLRPSLGRPNGLLAWATGLTFAVAAVAAWWARRRTSLALPTTLDHLAALSLIGLADQFRYGLALLDLVPIVNGRPVATVHDVAALGGTLVPSGLARVVLAGCTLSLGIGLAGALAWSAKKTRAARAMRLLAGSVVLAFTSGALYTLLPGRTLVFAAETFELAAAAVLVIAALNIATQDVEMSGFRRRLWHWVGEEPILAEGHRAA